MSAKSCVQFNVLRVEGDYRARAASGERQRASWAVERRRRPRPPASPRYGRATVSPRPRPLPLPANKFNRTINMNINRVILYYKWTHTCRRCLSTQSVTAGHMAPRWRASAARASSSLTLTPGARRAAAARTPAHRLGQRSRSHASGATGFCANAACTSAALNPSLSASVIRRASSRPLSASRLTPVPANASREIARFEVRGSGDAAWIRYDN